MSNILMGSVKYFPGFRKSDLACVTVTHMYPCMLAQDLCFFFKLLFSPLGESNIKTRSQIIFLKCEEREESKLQFIYIATMH